MNSLKEGAALKIEDLKSQAEPFLTEKTKTALNVKSTSMFKWRANADKEAYMSHKCLYVGKRVKISEVEDGIKAVAEKINALGEAGKIDSAVSHFIKFDLFQIDTNREQETIVLCYPVVDIETYNEIMANPKEYNAFVEGAIPE